MYKVYIYGKRNIYIYIQSSCALQEKKFKCPWHMTEIKENFVLTLFLKMALKEYASLH